jgi:glycosyltransferase involved in cell wall biosynthesis
LNSAIRVAVVQDGARLHYLLPLGMLRAGLLDCVFAEYYAAPGSLAERCAQLISKIRPSLGERMLLRHCPELPKRLVRTNNWLALSEQFAHIGAGRSEVYFRRCTDLVGRWIRRAGLGDATALVGFVRNIDPLLCRYARRRGVKVVCDQMIAPAFVEDREHRLQADRWPGWEPSRSDSSVRALEHQTWAECHHLTAPSDYVKEGLIEEGTDPAKVTVVPYPVTANWFQPIDRANRDKPLTIGFIGAVNLRKGSPYFFETARKLAGGSFRFIMVGPVDLNPEAVAQHRGAVELVGRKTRQKVAQIFDEMDVFYFPSTCEGSAGSVMEAMTAGLPVVCSPSTGSVVRDGVDGYLVPYDDTDLAVERLLKLARDAELRLTMGRSARTRAASFDLDFYSRMWTELILQVSGEYASVLQGQSQSSDRVGAGLPIG